MTRLAVHRFLSFCGYLKSSGFPTLLIHHALYSLVLQKLADPQAMEKTFLQKGVFVNQMDESPSFHNQLPLDMNVKNYSTTFTYPLPLVEFAQIQQRQQPCLHERDWAAQEYIQSKM
jgi:hypothetical protein